MTLKKYRKKRDFKKTPEPAGRKKASPKKLKYVIQKHHARHLHYDLRLEMNGVLKSWAVPKGPSQDPNIKRLAVEVEDHPLEYANFEGEIPQGAYGAGKVKIWDKGEWIPLDKSFKKSYQAGHLHFEIKGKKLKGEWQLIRLKDTKNWILFKTEDPKLPKKIHPELATLVDAPPKGKEWLHEVKFDGYRLLAFIDHGKVKLLTRNTQNWTSKFPGIVESLESLEVGTALLDGELIAVNDKKQSDFQLLQNLIHEKNTDQLVYYVFDLPHLNGKDLSLESLVERKRILKTLHLKGNLQYSDHIVGNGDKIFKKACKIGLEGIISKNAKSQYIQKRTKDWLKTKCFSRQEFVVCGFTKPQGSRQYFGSLILGVYDKHYQLQFCGSVGTGFNEASLKSIYQLLTKYQTTHSPFSKTPNQKNITWITPKLVVEVEFKEWTHDGMLRHPSFKGLRKDKPPVKIAREKTDKIFLTHPEKMLYPNISKRDLAKFYEKIQKWILPYIVGRPLSLLRCPEGFSKHCFYQKHLEHAREDRIFKIKMPDESQKPFVYIKNLKGLLELVQMDILEIHPWNCSIKHLDKPDCMIFDLDPGPNVPWTTVVKAARFIKTELESLNLKSFVKTTGKKGLHIVVPLKPVKSWKEMQFFCKQFAAYLAQIKPNMFTDNMSKSKRSGKIFVDYLRNQKGATSIAPYSTRIHENATVATPLSWRSLSSKIKPDSFTVKNIFKHLRSNPWENYHNLQKSQSI